MLDKVNATRLIVIFHRNLSDTHRGQGIYIRRLVSLLSQYFDTYVIDSSGLHKFGLSDEIPKLDGSFFHDFKKSILSFTRWIITERDKKNTIVLSEDLYISVFVIPLSILFSIQTIFRSSDFGLEYRKRLFQQIGIKSKTPPLLMNLTETLICKISNLIIVPSSDNRDLMIKSGISADKIDIYPYRAYKSNYNPDEIQKFKQENAMLNKTIVTFIGNMSYRPNLEAAYFIIKLAAEYVKGLPDDNIIYIIAGKNSDHLKKYSTSFLRVLGEMNDIGILLNASDIGLNPSLVPGGSSIKIVDYLVNGLLVISTKEGSHGIIKSDRIIVCNREEFREQIKNFAEKTRNGSFKKEPIPENITNYYLSDKWGIEILNKLRKLRQ